MTASGWAWGRLSDVVSEIHAGYSVVAEDRPATAGEAAVLRTGAVIGGQFKPHEQKAVTHGVDRLRVRVRPDSVLMGRKNSAELVGSAVHVDREHGALYLSDLIWELKPAECIDSRWLACALQHGELPERVRISATGTQSTMKNLNRETVLALPVLIPPVKEQSAMADILRTWDDAIAATTRARALQRDSYAALVETLAAASTNMRALGSLTSQLSARNADGKFGRSDVMGVSNRRGLIPMREQTISSELGRYRMLPPKAFAYNPMRIDVGSIAMSRRSSDVIVSPDYVLFACNVSLLLPEYLNHVLATRRWRHDVSAGSSGSVRTRTYYDDLAAIRIHVPEVAEQARIAGALDAMQEEIALLDRQLELLREQKRGLAEKLLSGAIRVANRGRDD